MSAATVTIPEGVDGAMVRSLLAEPAAALARGELVAFPTETVYGLGADARSAAAVEAVFAAKGRPSDNPLIVHIADTADLPGVAEVTPLASDLAARFWPGPLTLVLQARPGLPGITTAGLDTVAVRVPAPIVARTLVDLAGTPVAAPSANTSGRPSPTTAAHVDEDLGDKVAWIIDGGPCRIGIESTVVDARGEVPVVLREGAVTREMLGQSASEDGSVRAPGTRHRHYQPRAAVLLAPPGRGLDVAAAAVRTHDRVGLVAPVAGAGPDGVVVLARPADGEALANVLYAALRQADALGLPAVVVEGVADVGVGRAVMDRLRRARHDGG